MTGTMKSEIYPWLCKGMFFALVLFLATAPLSTMAEGKFLSAIDDSGFHTLFCADSGSVEPSRTTADDGEVVISIF